MSKDIHKVHVRNWLHMYSSNLQICYVVIIRSCQVPAHDHTDAKPITVCPGEKEHSPLTGNVRFHIECTLPHTKVTEKSKWLK